MAENTEIQWPDHTFNPWLGCTKIGPGCKFCYAEAQMDKWLGRVKWGPAGDRMRTSEAYWRGPIRWNKNLARGWVWRCENCNERLVTRGPREVLGDCKSCGLSVWRNIRREKVFCASLADVFEDNPQVEDWLLDLLRLIFDTPYLDWLLLTKRPQNVIPFMDDACWLETGCPMFGSDEPLPRNVWLGTSVENQAAVDERIPQLAAVPARVRFLSVEPLLGPVSLWEWLAPNSMYKAYCHQKRTGHKSYGSAIDDDAGNIKARCPDCEAVFCDNDPQVNWVIIGGESGPNARPLELAWVRDIVNQCRAAHVPVFVKQLGSVWAKQNGARHPKGGDMAEWPTDLRVREQVDAGGLRIEL